MIRYFCDQCQREIERESCSRLTLVFGKMQVQVITGVRDGAWNDGNFCHPCQREAVDRGEPMTKQEIVSTMA